jgi:transglutaminase-like putative cysteine protease
MISANRLILWLLYVATLVSVLPVFGALARWLQLVLIAAAILVPVADRWGKTLLSNLSGSLVALVALLFYIPQLSRSNIALPLIHILCLLLLVRVLGSKSARHLLQAFLLTTALLAASSLLTLDMLYLVCLVALILLIPTALVLLCFVDDGSDMRFSPSEFRLLLQPLMLLPLASLVSMVLLFFILPRTQTPFWDFLNPAVKATVALSDQVRPGDFAELSTSGAVAFRAETERLPAGLLYWRALVLNEIDETGKSWRRSRIPAHEETTVFGELREVSLFAEAKADRYLVSFDRSVELKGIRHSLEADGTAQVASREKGRLSYRSLYAPQAEFKLMDGRRDYLQLPGAVSPQLLALVVEISAGAQSYAEKRAHLDSFFLQQGLTYAAEGLEPTANPVEHFLFESRRGYCEYFATSYALLLRMLGVPARLVGGYLGGEYNSLGSYYLVAEDAAHVWVEALDDQSHWQRIDPSLLAANAATAVAGRSVDAGLSFQALSDLLYHFWTRAVLNYDFGQQFALIKGVGSRLKRFSVKDVGLFVDLPWFLLPLLLAGFFLRARQMSRAALVRAYRRQVARCCGLKRLPDSLGLYRIAAVTGHPLCAAFAASYGAAVYGGSSLSRVDRKALRRLVVQLKQVRFPKEVVIAISSS